MITLLLGENSFEADRALREITNSFKGAVERIDGSQVRTEQLADMLMGVSLLAESRLLVIRGLSENKAIWEKFEAWIPRLSPHIHLVLIESRLDKRTVTYKALKETANVKEFDVWDERDVSKIENWIMSEATKLGIEIDKKTARFLVQRVGADQWALHNALSLLSLANKIDIATIENIIESRPTENVFRLFETSLKADIQRLQDMLRHLSASEDPHRLFGLLTNQLFQLVTLTVSDKNSGEVAKDIRIHPYALSQLSPYAQRVEKAGTLRELIAIFAEADDTIKTSPINPWLAIEQMLIRIARL